MHCLACRGLLCTDLLLLGFRVFRRGLQMGHILILVGKVIHFDIHGGVTLNLNPNCV